MEVASRELRNSTRALLQRVQAGEEVTITVDGIAVATLQPVASRPRWMPRSRFLATVLPNLADPGLADDLRTMLPDTTDDVPL